MIDQNKNLALAALTVQDVPASARLLLAALTLIGDETDAGRTVISTRRDLARIVGVTPRSVLRSIQALERAGLLARTPRYDHDGSCVASSYTVLTDHLAPEGGSR